MGHERLPCAWGPNAIGRFTDGDGAEQIVGMIDFAGSGVVHMTGGFAALMGAKILGRRIGRFEERRAAPLPASSTLQARDTPATPPPAAPRPPSTPSSTARPAHRLRRPPSRAQVLGTFLLWFGWYGFNPGSTLAAHGTLNDPTVGTAAAARSAVTTTLSAAVAGISGLFIKRFLPPFLGGIARHVRPRAHGNSLLGGLVAITAGCSVVATCGAIVIGFIAAAAPTAARRA